MSRSLAGCSALAAALSLAPLGDAAAQIYGYTDENGAAVDARALLAGIDPDGEGFSNTVVLGMPPGHHRLIAFAKGHRACIVEFDLADGEQRELNVVLPRR